MGGLFSKKSKPPTPVQNCEITEQDQAILQLKTQRDKMKQFIKRKEKCLEKERELAKELIREGKKDKALLLLKKKRFQENVIDQTLQQLNQIERMVNDLEFADIQQRAVEGLRNASVEYQQLVFRDQTGEYVAARSNAMETIEGSIHELGQIFSQLASLVSEQGEVITRIDSNVDAAAHTEHVRYFANIRWNHWLIIKVFGIVMVFFSIFVTFLA